MHSIDPYETPLFDQGPLSGEGDELVRRLRGLKWTEVDPQLRFRCWEQFSQKLADRGVADDQSTPPTADSRSVYEFSRGERLRRSTGELRLPNLFRRVSLSQGPGGRLDLGRPLSRRGGLSPAARFV
jgi:hypothetical protein